jgi:hypothetical protein
MGLPAKLQHELRAVISATLFFGVWIGALMLLKTLVLDEYHIGFSGWSKAVLGALVLAKVVLILEHVPLGAWVRARPAWVDVALRTALYAAGTLLVLVIEHGLHGRREHGGFLAAVAALPGETTFPHVAGHHPRPRRRPAGLQPPRRHPAAARAGRPAAAAPGAATGPGRGPGPRPQPWLNPHAVAMSDADWQSKRTFSWILFLFILADAGSADSLPVIALPAQ